MHRPIAQRLFAALLVLNLLLLAGLAMTAFTPLPAEAQLGSGPQKFTMLSGAITGRNNQDVVYIVDTQTGNMIAAMYNGSNRTFDVIGHRSITADLNRRSGR